MFKSFWVRTLLLNCLMVALAYTGARLVVTTFATRDLVDIPTAQAISETRENIDKKFFDIPPSGVDRYEFWANRVEAAFDQGHIAAANGYMLSAPQMLPKDDAAAVIAASNKLTFGATDERLLHAVTLFLPDYVRVKYDRVSSPDIRNKFTGYTAEYVKDAGTAGSALSARQSFKVLGDTGDLVAQAEAWMRDPNADSVELKLIALATLLPPEETAPLEMLSILNVAYKSGRLSYQFEEIVRTLLSDAFPDETLEQNLTGVVDQILPTRERVKRTRAAFEAAFNKDAINILLRESVQIKAIVDSTDHNGMLLLFEHIRSWDDIKRTRLLAEAGGPRSVALADYLGAEMFTLADSGFRWSLDFVYNAMLVISILLSLGWLFGYAIVVE